MKALAAAARGGTSFGAPSPLEVELGERVRTLMPSIERVRFVSSGTEAAMSAVRVARAATGRDRILKFEGCYHGHADAFLVKAGSGALTLGTPTSPGVTRAASADTLVASYNDLGSVRQSFAANRGQIAAVIVEPIAGNMGVVPPADGFLRGLREICTAEGALLIFDEVISGFRASAGGAQGLTGVRPDLTCLGKIIGGGLPVGAYGGRADLMALVSPAGPVYQAGTLSGNPLAMTAGLWCLNRLTPRLYTSLSALGARLAAGLADAAREAGVALQVNGVRIAADAVLHRSPGARLRLGDQREHRTLRGASSAACCRAESIRRRRSSKRGFCRPRTPGKTSIRRSRLLRAAMSRRQKSTQTSELPVRLPPGHQVFDPADAGEVVVDHRHHQHQEHDEAGEQHLLFHAAR